MKNTCNMHVTPSPDEKVGMSHVHDADAKPKNIGLHVLDLNKSIANEAFKLRGQGIACFGHSSCARQGVFLSKFLCIFWRRCALLTEETFDAFFGGNAGAE